MYCIPAQSLKAPTKIYRRPHEIAVRYDTYPAGVCSVWFCFASAFWSLLSYKMAVAWWIWSLPGSSARCAIRRRQAAAEGKASACAQSFWSPRFSSLLDPLRPVRWNVLIFFQTRNCLQHGARFLSLHASVVSSTEHPWWGQIPKWFECQRTSRQLNLIHTEDSSGILNTSKRVFPLHFTIVLYMCFIVFHHLIVYTLGLTLLSFWFASWDHGNHDVFPMLDRITSVPTSLGLP